MQSTSTLRFSALSKGHTLNFNSGAGTFNDPRQGRVLDLSGGGYVDAKDIGDNNFAVLRDLTILLSARVDTLDGGTGDNTLVAFGGADGSANSDLLSQESANHAYKLSMTAAGNLQLAWQHDDRRVADDCLGRTRQRSDTVARLRSPPRWRQHGNRLFR